MGSPHPDIVSWIDCILISSYVWRDHSTTLADVLTKLCNVCLSVNSVKSRFAASSQEFSGMIMDATGMKHAPSTLEAIANMSGPAIVEELRSSLGLTRYIRNFVPRYSVIVLPLTN